MRFFSSLFAIAFIAFLLLLSPSKASAVTLTITCKASTPGTPAPLVGPVETTRGQIVTWSADQVYCSGGGCTSIILSYSWTGDVHPGSTGSQTSITYQSLGLKRAYLHVSDPSGSSADNSCTINVVAALAPTPTPTPTPTPNPSGSGPSAPVAGMCGIGAADAATFASKLFGCGISLVGGTAMLFIIYGGYMLVTSTGDPTRLRKGKEYITYAIVGLLLAVFTLVILEVIGVNIFHLPGFGA